MSDRNLRYYVLAFALSFTLLIMVINALQKNKRPKSKLQYTERVSPLRPAQSVAKGEKIASFTESQQKLRVAHDTYGPESLKTASLLGNIGTLYPQEDQYGEAELHYKKASMFQGIKLDEDHPHLARNMARMGVLYLAQNRPEEAKAFLKQAVAIWEKHPETDDTLARISTETLAMIDTPDVE